VTPPSESLYPEILVVQAQTLKRCKACLRDLPLASFGTFHHGERYRGSCKNCERTQKVVRAEMTVANNPVTSKICAKCGLEKPVSDFTYVRLNLDHLHSYCKDCKRVLEHGIANTKAENKRLRLKAEYEALEPSLRPSPKVCGNPMCVLVGQLQPPENFDVSKIHISGLRIDCRLCELARRRLIGPKQSSKEYHDRWYQEHKNELNQFTKEWRKANPEECRRLHIERRFRQYGVTVEWYAEQLILQDGKCAICGSADPKNPSNTFHVDHYHGCCSKSCHACDNCRRGLLCSPCNTSLGILEKVEWKRKAIAYLNKYSKKPAVDPNQGSLFDF